MSESAPDSRGTTARSHGRTNPVTFTPDFTKTLTTSSPRFGSLSHHSFFSRHNPHPNRVRHIQGLNGRPVCTVRDDWFVTSSLYPHPLLKSHVHRKAAAAAAPSFGLPLAETQSRTRNKSGMFSEAWRDELKELAAKVSLSSQADKQEARPEDEPVRRKTQYSAETGRIVPPSSRSHQRRSNSLVYHQPFRDQELLVLELLCQILQTDSLSSVQQWLLLAGQREKDLVMGMIKQALDGVELSGQRAFHPGASPPIRRPSLDQPWRKTWRASSDRGTGGDDKPERIGDAEVLEIRAEDPSGPEERE